MTRAIISLAALAAAIKYTTKHDAKQATTLRGQGTTVIKHSCFHQAEALS